MNAANIMKLMGAKQRFEAGHPKFFAFCDAVYRQGLEEGMVMELTVTRPGQEPMTTNLKVRKEDLELLNEVRNLAGSR